MLKDELKEKMIEFIKIDGDIDALVAEAKKQAFMLASIFKIINETTIAVNLGATPNTPFDGARVEQHIGDGWVIVERRDDGLYVNDRKVVLYLSKQQQNGKYIRGHELREELTGKPVLNANILDALYDNSHLIPEDWKEDTRYIFFWGTIYYRDAYGDLFVRCLCFYGGAWCRDCNWLDSGWIGSDPAALLAS